MSDEVIRAAIKECMGAVDMEYPDTLYHAVLEGLVEQAKFMSPDYSSYGYRAFCRGALFGARVVGTVIIKK